jgi:dTDP-glucose pyrophosphorylase
MDEAGKRILFVEDGGKLAGIITDGDFRRFVLRGGGMTVTVKEVMNPRPLFVRKGEEARAYKMMAEKSIECIPVLDAQNRILAAVFRNQDIQAEKESIGAPTVIMAGGQGQRLYPYTKILPKPLIPIGDLTIIERIANNFVAYGCTQFYFTLNYKKNIIKAYFGDLNYDVTYVDEDIPLGTGGSLFYLKDKIQETFFVSNCDILINADYADIYRFHKEQGNIITVVASMKNTVIPYGVIELDDAGNMKRTIEKPNYHHLVNTGMYVIEPCVLDNLTEPCFIHLTDIIEQYLARDEKIGVYPIGESAWLDMGQIKEMENMVRALSS